MVGVTEQFDLTLLLLKQTFGWRHIDYVRANIGVNRPPSATLGEDTIAAVRRHNQLDIRLYEEARRLLAQQTAGWPWRLRARGYELGKRLRKARGQTS